MKRVLSSVSRLLKSKKFKKFAIVLLIFGSGVLCGSVITGAVSKDSKSNSASRSSSNISNEDRAKRTSERIEESYKKAKDRTQKDLEAKRIDQKKADEINKKLDEIYNYRKENVDLTSDEKRQELQNKRKDWREWLDQNEISSRYFIGLI